MLSNKRTSDPAIEPITAEELDTHLRGDGVLASEEGKLLDGTITAAREYIEEFTRQALITQSWTMFMDTWPTDQSDLGWWDGVREGSITQGNSSSVELPKGPLQSVTEITTFDMDNSETTFASSNYFLDTNATPGRVILNTGATWPIFTRNQNGIKIVYVAGFGDAATDVPGALRMAIKQLAAHWYENREFIKTQAGGNLITAPIHVQSILNRYRIQRL